MHEPVIAYFSIKTAQDESTLTSVCLRMGVGGEGGGGVYP